ncbi:MAG: hypothetical protein FH749_13145 [Firmicutes bacterium]|nr:hypothetical protein [Bacillota bacterium]
MAKYPVIGLAILSVLTMVALIQGDIYRMGIYAFVVAGILFAVAAFLSGMLASGDRNRANMAMESREDTRSRQALVLKLVLIGMPNLIGAFLIWYFGA